MTRYLVWLFWTVTYWFRPTPRDLEPYLVRGIRTRPPWWRFRPHCWHDPDFGGWEIRLTPDETFSVTNVALPCWSVMLSCETGRVVGFRISDELMEQDLIQRNILGAEAQ